MLIIKNNYFYQQDVDAYIHRSGRTGRAGRTGICVMFYKPREEFRIPQVLVFVDSNVSLLAFNVSCR